MLVGTDCNCDCCNCPPGCKTPGGFCDLPEFISLTATDVANRTAAPYLIQVKIEANFGSGATAKATVKVDDPIGVEGPISSVSVISGGGGYATVDRIEPSLEITGSGTGATFTPTFVSDQLLPPTWQEQSVSVSGGEDYTDGEYLSITPNKYTIANGEGVLRLTTSRAEPEVTASLPAGVGAEVGLKFSELSGYSPPRWGITTATVVEGGEDYNDGDSVTISLGPRDVCLEAASLVIRTTRYEPTLTAAASDVNSGVNGTGASLSVTLAVGYEDPGSNTLPVWRVDEITITNGGSGYEVDDPVTITIVDGELHGLPAFILVSEVDANGAITAVQVGYGGEYIGDSGVVFRIDIVYGGEYYRDSGVPESVQVVEPGQYYQLDLDSLEVASVSVTLVQEVPSDGSGAQLDAVVVDDVLDPDFGKISEITVTNGGSDYVGRAIKSTPCQPDPEAYPAAYEAALQKLEDLNTGSHILRRLTGDWYVVFNAPINYQGRDRQMPADWHPKTELIFGENVSFCVYTTLTTNDPYEGDCDGNPLFLALRYNNESCKPEIRAGFYFLQKLCYFPLPATEYPCWEKTYNFFGPFVPVGDYPCDPNTTCHFEFIPVGDGPWPQDSFLPLTATDSQGGSVTIDVAENPFP